MFHFVEDERKFFSNLPERTDWNKTAQSKTQFEIVTVTDKKSPFLKLMI